MAYKAPIIKDRVAVGDDLYLIVDEGGKKRLIPSPTEVIEEGTPINKEFLQALCDAAENAETKHHTVTASLSVGGWSSLAQTVNVSGVTADNTVIISPAPSSQEIWSKAQIVCTSQANGKLTFGCKKVPTAAVTANIVILGG